MSDSAPPVLSPVLHLFTLLIPTVANAFLLVYVLLGLVLEDEQRLQWEAEALEVALYTAAGVGLFCTVLFLVQRASGRPARHPLALVNLVQIGLAAVLLGSVAVLYVV